MHGKSLLVLSGTLLLIVGYTAWPTPAQKTERPPHGQDHLPGPALSPAEAIQKMTVPEGFRVELVAAEPGIVNPVAMTFDERGRIWITESLEYPRRSAGPGRDRIKVLESTQGDGKYDKITVFAEGLNIPSGIAVGHGGVWVANSPDILFYREGPDGKAAGKPEVVVTGFGRFDTHELPNSLTWGPDGWLYGLNGVFNAGHVKQGGNDYQFTCTMFRIHPRTKQFELFCEGTSNPWGIAFDTEGSAFVSACVIDHLWHLTQTGYYHRQGGPYPPFTWKIESIVKHRHQKAAYCGIVFFDSDAYPPEYREKLYMGNIHGGCINCDELTRDGSTYFGKPRPDLLTANDAWFMPVSQKVGPDGCLYVLDWYDRYHCYQDANRDPAGIDRERGRLYRLTYKHTPAAGLFDLGKESEDKLIERLHSPNVYFRDVAQRLLAERLAARHPDFQNSIKQVHTRARLEDLVLDASSPRKARLHALWSLMGGGGPQTTFLQKMLGHEDATFRAWGVRAAAHSWKVAPAVRERVVALAGDPAADVRLQVAIAARKIEGIEPMTLLLDVLKKSDGDKLIPHIVWQNLHPLLEDQGNQFIRHIEKADFQAGPGLAVILPRALERMLSSRKPDDAALAALVARLCGDKNPQAPNISQCLAALAGRVQTREIPPARQTVLAQALKPTLTRLLAGKQRSPLYGEAVVLGASLGDPECCQAAQSILGNANDTEDLCLRALRGLLHGGDELAQKRAIYAVEVLLRDKGGQRGSMSFRGQVIDALGRADSTEVAHVVLTCYARLEPQLQPRAIELLTQRVAWSKRLLAVIASKKIPANALSVNHVRKLLAFKDQDLTKQVIAVWGTVRDVRNPEREKVVERMRTFLQTKRGDAVAGMKVFKTVCAQCHKIYGEGVEVGPDVTVNGRASFDQLLSNVFDPSLVIGADYQATTVVTLKGQVFTGLVAEDGAQRVVLKTQGGKLETIPRAEVESIAVSTVSLMPEGLENQLQPQEIANLFAFLTLDRPPGDPKARLIPGTPR